MCDAAGNCVVVCSIENLDPMGVHTGDSWTVAPQQTLPDAGVPAAARGRLRLRAHGRRGDGRRERPVRVRPETRRARVIEMNPRVSRSSALASKATGFPIAKLAALLAVGYTLDELPNDITGSSSAAFEPALDYVAVKAPRFDFEKFPGAEPHARHRDARRRRVARARPHVPRGVPEGARGPRGRRGEPARDPGLHPYFAAELESIREAERRLAETATSPREALRPPRLADRAGARPRRDRGARAAGRCPAGSPSTRARPSSRRGRRTTTSRTRRATDEPSRPAARSSCSARARTGSARASSSTTAASARRRRSARLGYEAGARQLEPRDRLDRLRHVGPALPRAGHARARARRLRARAAGRRRRLARRPDAAPLAHGLAEAGVPLLGDPLAGDRRRRGPRALRRLLDELGIARAALGRRRHGGGARRRRIGYPVLVRPAPRPRRPADARRARARRARRPRAVLVDQFLEGALELDVDALCDGESAWVAGDPRARRARRRPLGRLGVRDPGAVGHGGARGRDPRAAPPRSPAAARRARPAQPPARAARRRALRLEANPRASRTVPFVAKATGVPLVDHACRLLLGEPLAELDLPERAAADAGVGEGGDLPERALPGAAERGPEMRSTGEVITPARGRHGLQPCCPRAPARRRRRRPGGAARRALQGQDRSTGASRSHAGDVRRGPLL